MIRMMIVIALTTGLAAGCSSMAVEKRMEAFGEASTAYRQAISWSEYDIAAAFLKSADRDTLEAKIEHLKQFKVTAYEPRHMVVLEGEHRIRQIVKISYFRNDNLVVKAVRDEQLWEYDPQMRSWFLLSGLPQFE